MTEQANKAMYSIPEIIKITGVGRSKLYQELNARRLKGVKVGTRTYITAENLQTWLSALNTYLPRNQEGA